MKRPVTVNKKLVLGITGSFGSGKSTVAGMFKNFGAEVLDADKIAHQVISPGRAAYKKIVSLFGNGILKKNSEIRRDKLAKRVFGEKNLLKRLGRIIHPQVIRIMRERIKKSPKKIIVLDVPLLIEAHLDDLTDKIIVVTAAQERQLVRLKQKTHLSRLDILKRIRAQMPILDKVRMADFVIDNNGTIGQTKQQVEVILGKMGILPRINSHSNLRSRIFRKLRAH